MKAFLKGTYGIEADKIKQLDGYNNCNYLITSGDDQFIYKTYPYSKDIYEITKAENQVLIHLKVNGLLSIPIPLHNKANEFLNIEENEILFI